MLEELWTDMIIPLNGRNRIVMHDPIQAEVVVLGTTHRPWVTIRNLDLRFVSLWQVLNGNVFAGNNPANGFNANSAAMLRVYPDLLSRAIDPVQFESVHAALLQGSNLGNGTGLGGGAQSRFNVSLDGPVRYPTNAWSPQGSPHLFGADGNLNLDWGINDLDGAAREARFRLALSQVLGGVWPLMEVLFLERDGIFN